MWVTKVSVPSERIAPGSGCASGTAVIRAALAAANVIDIVGSQVGTFRLPASAAVSSRRVLATSRRKLC
jgi:hypothetical protein